MVLQVVPYLLVLIGALLGFNIFLVLVAGILASVAVGLGTGMFAFSEIFNIMGSGITGMYDITVISIIVCCMGSLMKEAGGIQAVLDFIKSKVKSRKSAQLGIAALVAGIDRILDMGRTVVNITGDAACAVCVNAMEEKKKAKKAEK